MSETITDASDAAPAAASCCSTTAQAACCEPGEKVACCGAEAAAGGPAPAKCGCS